MSPLTVLMLGAALLLIYAAFNGNSPFDILKGIIPAKSSKKAS